MAAFLLFLRCIQIQGEYMADDVNNLVEELLKYNSFIAKEQQLIKDQLAAHRELIKSSNEEHTNYNFIQDNQLNEINKGMMNINGRIKFLEEKSEKLSISTETIKESIKDFRYHLDNGWRKEFIEQQKETFNTTLESMKTQVTTLTEVVKSVTEKAFDAQNCKEKTDQIDIQGKWSFRKQLAITIAAVLGSSAFATLVQIILNRNYN